MKSSTEVLNHTSKISDYSDYTDEELEREIQSMLYPATVKYNAEIDSMATELLHNLNDEGDVPDKAQSRFLDRLMLSTDNLYNDYQRIVSDLGAPMTDAELESKKQAMMNRVIDITNNMLERVRDNGLYIDMNESE